uniref:Uncharacterized protein n=1 Tax=Arundo donax TaxID=35708 RepID=A0A0A8YLK9_ARUDO
MLHLFSASCVLRKQTL